MWHVHSVTEYLLGGSYICICLSVFHRGNSRQLWQTGGLEENIKYVTCSFSHWVLVRRFSCMYMSLCISQRKFSAALWHTGGVLQPVLCALHSLMTQTSPSTSSQSMAEETITMETSILFHIQRWVQAVVGSRHIHCNSVTTLKISNDLKLIIKMAVCKAVQNRLYLAFVPSAVVCSTWWVFLCIAGRGWEAGYQSSGNTLHIPDLRPHHTRTP